MKYLLFPALLLIGGCTFNAAVNISPAHDISSNYSGKVNGKLAFYTETRPFDNVVAMNDGNICSGHTYKINAAQPFTASAFQTFTNLVENIEEVHAPIPRNELAVRGLTGMIILRGENIRSRLSITSKFFYDTVRADTNITASLSVLGHSGTLLSITSSQDGVVQHSDWWGMCDSVTKTISMATEEAMKRLLFTLGERFTNSSRIRATADL